MINLFPIPALTDNYIWCLHTKKHCIVVDPGESTPVMRALQNNQLELTAILVTHHHHDHTGGIKTLLEDIDVPVIGPKEIIQVTHPIKDNTSFILNELQIELLPFSIPGHTLEHIAYYTHGKVFTGDTLFTGGCGRIFEGTIAQMYQSLTRLKALPDDTLVYCGHEYTEQNLKFAQQVEPENELTKKRYHETIQLRAQFLSTVPANLWLEKQTNPFLRCEHPAVIRAASHYAGRSLSDPVEVLGVIRAWKNLY